MGLDPFKAIQTALGINKAAVKIIVGAFVIMVLALFIWQVMQGDEGLYWQILAAMAGFSILMMVLTVFPLLARRLVGWVMALCMCAWATSLTAQVISGGRLPIAPASCIASFYMSLTCSVSTVAASSGVAPDIELVTRSLDPAPAVPPTDYALSKVFIQFANLARDETKALAAGLVANGWQIPGAGQGGEHIASADGLNEVRYFNAHDADLARALATDIAANRPVIGEVVVKDLTGTAYAMENRGHLEVWISR